jgi:acyl carrier protein
MGHPKFSTPDMESPSPAEIELKVYQLICEHFPAVESLSLRVEDNLLESGAVDSLGLLVIVDLLETNFVIKVEDTDVVMENFGTVSSLARFVQSKRSS